VSTAARSFFFAIAAAAALALSYFLESPALSGGPLVVISAVLGVVVAAVVEWLTLRLPLRFGPLRRIIDGRAAFEGVWIIEVHDQPERSLALAVVEYNEASDNYNYHGVAFDDDYQVRATWHSQRVVIDVERNQLIHIGEGTIFGSPSETVRNFGLLSFERGQKGAYTRGYAFFVDFGSSPIKRSYTLERVAGSPVLSTHDEVRQFLVARFPKAGRLSKHEEQES
jgi:hypothetical protein